MTDQLGTLLRRLRSRAGLTQEQAAERSGVSVRTIRRLETGKSTDHRLGTVNLLADALDLGHEDRRGLAAVIAKSPTVSSAIAEKAVADPQERVAPADPQPSGPFPVIKSTDGVLVEAAEELARQVRRRRQLEEEMRRIHDPFPLPVRWQRANVRLTDHAENIQRLPPGAASPLLDVEGDLSGVAEVYRKVPSGRLVILGRAGSGKSVLAIRLIVDLLDSPAPSGRVPVAFSVGSWDATAIALRDWLVERLLRDFPHLARRTPGGSTLAAALVDADLVLPVLDGFDEIAEGLRGEALEALNATSLPLVLTSRSAEYAEAVRVARSPLVWAAGIELTDLTLDDLLDYLPRTVRPVAHDEDGAGAPWAAVLEELRSPQDRTAAENLVGVLRTPLMVTLARTVYSEAPDEDATELLDAERFPTGNSLEEHLLAGFVPTVYRPRAPERNTGRPRRQRRWKPEQAQRWLGYLAHHMDRLDRQDLAWWQIGDSLGRSTRILTVMLASALCIAVADWTIGLLVAPVALGETLVQGAMMGPAAGLAFGSVYGAIVASGGGTFEPSRVRVRLQGRPNGVGRGPVRAFTARFAAVLMGGFVMGIGCACAFALQRALYYGQSLVEARVIEGTLINMLVFGLIFGSAAGLVFGLVAALEAPLDASFAATPASLLSSNRRTVYRQVLVIVAALTLTIAFGGHLVVDLLRGVLGPMNWSVSDGLLIGAVGGFGGGLSYALCFTAWGQWLVLSRVVLPLTGKLPWRTAAFLDDAYRRGVLRQTGAVYQFRHARLQHHLGRSYRHHQAQYRSARLPVPGSGPVTGHRHPTGARRTSPDDHQGPESP
ncbi:helix-turn-helix domain-containing protein [Streptomyces sp. NPDC059176]|uniref:helix-turn-helix domain-containing protein n=1 Tax=Streptomyces sp. NPDC059176 TaxID=3346758 RepID=UPI0036A6735C